MPVFISGFSSRKILWRRSRPRCRVVYSTKWTKNQFALGDAPGDVDELANYTFRKKALLSSLLRGHASGWEENHITSATRWENVRTTFINLFSDGWNKFRHRKEVEHFIRGDEEEIRNFLHRINKTVDKSWPDDLNGNDALNKTQNETLKHDKEEKDTSTFRWKDVDLETYKESTKISAGKTERYVK